MQQAYEQHSRICGMGLWKSYSAICLSRLQKKPQDCQAASSRFVYCWSIAHKLPFMSIQQSDWTILQLSTAESGRLHVVRSTMPIS